MKMQEFYRASKYIRQKLIQLQERIDKSTIIVHDFNTTVSICDRTSTQKMSKDTADLNNTINQLDLTEFKEHSINSRIYITFKYTQNHYPRDYILSHKTILNKF